MTYAPGTPVWIVPTKVNQRMPPLVARVVKDDGGLYVTCRVQGYGYDTEYLRRRLFTTQERAVKVIDFLASRWEHVVTTWLETAWQDVDRGAVPGADLLPKTRERTRVQPIAVPASVQVRVRERSRA